MSTSITIQGTVIDFPTSADSPNWASAIDSFAQSVAGALDGIAGTFDVPPLILPITADVNTNVNIPRLSFPTSNVIGATIRYSYSRTSNSAHEVETGTILLIYDATTGSWQISRECVGSDNTKLLFNITNAGQVQYSTAAIGGTFNTGVLCYAATAIAKS